MSTAEDSRNPNFLRSMFEKDEFVCTAELVLGRDHNMTEAEDFVKEASEAQDGIKVISLTDLPGGNFTMVYLIVLLAVLARFILHIPNFSPMYGAILFGGAHLRKRDSVWFPLVLLGTSDFVLTNVIYRMGIGWAELLQIAAFAAMHNDGLVAATQSHAASVLVRLRRRTDSVLPDQ